MILLDKEYLPDGTDYSEVYERFIEIDNILNIRKDK